MLDLDEATKPQGALGISTTGRVDGTLTSLNNTYFATGNDKAAIWTGGFMILVAVYCWRYPSTVEEYDRRKAAGEKIAWFK